MPGPKKLTESLRLMRIFANLRGGGKRGNRIVIKFCLAVDVSDLITHANFGDDRFRVFRGGVGIEFPIFPLTCVVVFKTLWHYCASVWIAVST